MVSYQTLTELAFSVARAKGATFEGQRSEQAQAVIALVAELWNENKEQIKRMSRAQATRMLKEQIVVR